MAKRLNLCSILAAVSIILLLASCGESSVYTASKSFGDEQWGWNDPFQTSFNIEDTSQSYDLILDLKHGDSYKYQNIYLSVSTKFPTDTVVTSLLPINLAHKSGAWYGNCSGETCDLRVYLQEQVKFDQAGRYSIGFEQYTRQDSLRSIKNISFTIKRSQS